MPGDYRFPIVGIGASAGGLEALQGLLGALPADTGMAFVVVTHLMRERSSMMPSILARATPMEVVAAADRMPVEPNTVYVIPPNRLLRLRRGRLRLEPMEQGREFGAIDTFMMSLAQEAGENAIGIILSGSGSDGSIGLATIRTQGGFTMAQGSDGSRPGHEEMPHAAIATGAVDAVLPVERMGPRLADLAGVRSRESDIETDADDADESGFAARRGEISRLLAERVGHDFSGYKSKTFHRRVRRRMQVLGIASVDDYVTHLHHDPGEITRLFHDLLIGVTQFFRDPQTFEALQRLVVPRLFEGRSARDSVRVWVPGCATGEEAYSVAILLREQMDRLQSAPKVQLFATDIDENALAIARAGRYQASSLQEILPERRQRFFAEDNGNLTISKEVRGLCVFSTHNVLGDPPFSRIDLVCCRNLMIYFDAELQGRALLLFHFALKPGGFLFLGTSENVSQRPELFAAVDKKCRLFQRRDHVATPLWFVSSGGSQRSSVVSVPAGTAPVAMLVNLRRAVETRVLERFAPPHVVVNGDGDIIHYSARTGKYLEPAPGQPNRQLLAMARKGLRLDLRSALREALEQKRHAERRRVAFDIDDRVHLVDLAIEPIGDSEDNPLLLVVFQDVGIPVAGDSTAARARDVDRPVERLEQELGETRERLQITVEEYETAVEELKMSNEELQSINEELQSTNEELETSKEELQSVNEELQTVNSELSGKIEEVDRANSDLRNVFEATELAVVFLDRDLVIRSFTPAATAIFKLIDSDRGRPLTDIANDLVEIGDLRGEIDTVFRAGKSIERRVSRADGGVHYLMRVLPYRSADKAIEGALITFTDITQLVDAGG